jgi:hypothetical protein
VAASIEINVTSKAKYDGIFSQVTHGMPARVSHGKPMLRDAARDVDMLLINSEQCVLETKGGDVERSTDLLPPGVHQALQGGLTGV